MSRRFRLHTLQRLRSTAFEHATATLGETRRRLARAQLQVQTLEQAAIACVPPPRAAPDEVQVAAAHRNLLRDKADVARTEVSQAATDLAAALEVWHRARADLRAVENLHERHRQNLVAADARREQRLSDELAATVLRFPSLARAGARSPAADNDPDGGDAA